MPVREGYKQTEVGVIPEDWEVKTICDLTSDIGDGIHSTPVYSSTGKYYFINGNNIVCGSIKVSDDTKRVDEKEYQKNKRILSLRTIFLSINGTIGNLAIYNNEPVVLGKSAAYLNVREKYSLKYLYYGLQTKTTSDFFSDGLTGSTIKNLGLGVIRSTPLPIPVNSKEQTAIANALSDVDTLIQSLSALIAKKRLIKQGAMQTLLNPYDEDGQLKDGWVVKKLGELCGHVTTGKLDANAMVENGEYPFFTCAREYYSIDEYAFDEEALLISGNGANVGYVHYYKGKFNAYQRTYVLSKFSCDVHYLKIYMTANLQERIRVEVNAGNTPYILMGTLTNMDVRLPNNKEKQSSIATTLCDMDSEIITLETKLSKYQAIKQGMMQNLLTGHIRLIQPEAVQGA